MNKFIVRVFCVTVNFSQPFAFTDSLGKESYERLCRLFSSGLSINEVYAKCKDKVDFETVETCYLLQS